MVRKDSITKGQSLWCIQSDNTPYMVIVRELSYDGVIVEEIGLGSEITNVDTRYLFTSPEEASIFVHALNLISLKEKTEFEILCLVDKLSKMNSSLNDIKDQILRMKSDDLTSWAFWDRSHHE